MTEETLLSFPSHQASIREFNPRRNSLIAAVTPASNQLKDIRSKFEFFFSFSVERKKLTSSKHQAYPYHRIDSTEFVIIYLVY